MEELQFTPSAPVWQQVNEAIRKKRQKRRAIIWLPLLCLLLGGGLFWLETGQAEKPAINTAGTGRNETVATKPLPPQGAEQKQNVVTTTPNQPVSVAQEQIHQPSTAAVNTIKKRAQNKTALHTNTFGKEEHVYPGSGTTGAGKTTITEEKREGTLQVTRPPAEVAQVPQGENKAPQTTNHSTVDTSAAIAPGVEQKKSVFEDTLQHTDTARLKLKKQKAPAKWVFVPVVETGISGAAKAIDLDKATASYAIPQWSGTGPYPEANKPENNLAFSAGLLAQRQVGPRVQLETGLTYNYFSNTVDVGRLRRTDTVLTSPYGAVRVSEFYEKSAESNFTNRYHFISVPVALNVRLFSNTPVLLHAGVAASRLLAANSLSYSSQNRVYYKNHSALNRTQLSSELGLHYGFTGKKLQVNIGPQVRYHWTRLQKDDSPYRHLFTAGLRATAIF